MAINLYSKASVDSLLSAKLSDAPIDGSTYARKDGAWVVAGGGGSVSWGGILGTLADQTDLQNALDLKAPLASPTFTGTVTIPAGASIAGFAPLSSPTLTGTPLSTTAAADTNTTQIATTAFVVGQASSTTPVSNGTAAVGTSLKYARADHVHANPLPTGGTTGQVLSKVDGTNYNVQWATVGGGGGGGVDVQTFGSSTTSGSFTWTKPANAKYLEIWLFGGGGGGGSGAMQATTSARFGGGGGGGGSYLFASIGADAVPSSVTITVGAKGTGGASRTTAGSGNNGTAGGSTTFGSIFRALGGNFGSGGTTTSGFAGTWAGSQAFHYVTTTGSGGNGTQTNGSLAGTLNSFSVPSGGGGGAGAAASSVVNSSGGNGGTFSFGGSYAGLPSNIAGGSPGTSTGTPATNGADSPSAFFSRAGTGGGGGFYRTNFAGGTAGNGGWPGGGGGGGGASNDGFNSGAGGNGANGFAVIITYC